MLDPWRTRLRLHGLARTPGRVVPSVMCSPADRAGRGIGWRRHITERAASRRSTGIRHGSFRRGRTRGPRRRPSGSPARRPRLAPSFSEAQGHLGDTAPFGSSRRPGSCAAGEGRTSCGRSCFGLGSGRTRRHSTARATATVSLLSPVAADGQPVASRAALPRFRETHQEPAPCWWSRISHDGQLPSYWPSNSGGHRTNLELLDRGDGSLTLLANTTRPLQPSGRVPEDGPALNRDGSTLWIVDTGANARARRLLLVAGRHAHRARLLPNARPDRPPHTCRPRACHGETASPCLRPRTPVREDSERGHIHRPPHRPLPLRRLPPSLRRAHLWPYVRRAPIPPGTWMRPGIHLPQPRAVTVASAARLRGKSAASPPLGDNRRAP
jgi:hypothetical protein